MREAHDAATHPERAHVAPIVAHYRSTYLGATETFIHEMVANQRRYRPVALTHRRRNADQFVEPDDIRVIHGPGGRALGDLLARSVSLTLWHRGRALGRELDRLRPDLVHAHFGDDAAAALAPARRRGIPLVASFYGVDAMHRARQWRWRPLIRAVLEGSAAILAEGPHLRQRLVGLGADPARVLIQPIPIRLERFPFRPPRPPDGRRIVLLQACRFVPKKGVDLSIGALARVSRDADIELWLVGDGPERPALEALAAALGVADRVRFLGMMRHDEYARTLAAADLCIHPSRTAPDGDGEGGAPTVLLEAQAVGLPVVATTHADIPFVTDPDAVLLAPEDDVESLARHLDHLLTHPAGWEARARAGRRKVAAQHDPVRLARLLEDRYNALLEVGA